MIKRRKIESNKEWLNEFSKKIFKTYYLKQFAEEKFQTYPHLSLDHIYHISRRIDNFISSQLCSYSCNEDIVLLDSIKILDKKINKNTLFNHEACAPVEISSLSKLNAGDLESIEWHLSHEAIGINCNKIEMVSNPEDYREVIKEIIKEIATLYLRNFYNYLVTKPSLTDTQQTLVNTIESVLRQWEQTSSENSSIHTPENTHEGPATAPFPALAVSHAPQAS